MATLALFMSVNVQGRQVPQSNSSVPAKSSTPRSPAQTITVHGVQHVAKVTPLLYRGAQPSSEGYDALAKMGIDIVVDVRGTERESEGREVQRAGMKYVAIPWHCPFPKDKVFARFLRLIKENPNKKIFVHCRLGDDRGGMMIASYRMAFEGWSAQEAADEMKQFGFVRWHHFICPGLGRYESQFPEHLRNHDIFDSLGPWTKHEKPK